MHTYVVDEYQQWADRGYLNKLSCPKHADLSCLVAVNEQGIYIKCPLCLYKKVIGRTEYEQLKKGIEHAKATFRKE